MLFNSLEFALFFPIVTILYFLFAYRFRWMLLLSASCLFYMFFIPKYILILALTIAIDYSAGLILEKYQSRKNIRKLTLFISILSTCAVLFYFKYYNFFIDNINFIQQSLGMPEGFSTLKIILPIGLSFHTFQSLSYVIEVYLGRQKAVRHFGIYSLYVMYYPQLVAGPIERPQNLIHQFTAKHDFDYNRFTSGMRLILWGLLKKIVIADQLGKYVDMVFSNPAPWSRSATALAAAFFSVQIYCDFAGYTDMARGISRIMGIELMVNFKRPYFAQSITEFWQRWHISLSTWFRDYVYIPLGGNRRSQLRTRLNLWATFLISGLWHGANWTFVFWGGLNGSLLLLEKATTRFSIKSVLFRRIWVFCIMTFAWIFFRASTLTRATTLIKKILWPGIGSFMDVSHLIQGSKIYFVYFWVFILFLTEWYQEIQLKNADSLSVKLKSLPTSLRWAGYYFVAVTIVVSWVETTSHSFIYFQF